MSTNMWTAQRAPRPAPRRAARRIRRLPIRDQLDA
jgi:hypothetical protein